MRNTNTLRVRFKQFIAGDFHLVVAAWRRDYDKSLLKERHLRQETDASRAAKAVKYVRNGFISKATNLVHSFGVPLLSEGIFAQMLSKHPRTEEHMWEPPPPVEMDMSALHRLLSEANPLIGVGPRGFRSFYLSVLVKGRMKDPEAQEAYFQCEKLGKLYCNAVLPAWLRRRLGGGALTPVLKAASEPGKPDDARPVKAEDFDTSVYTKAVQRAVSDAVLNSVRPQQLGVRVSSGVELCIWGVKLWIEEKLTKAERSVVLKLDLKNAHNSFSRPKTMAALKKAALSSEKHAMLARAWHAMTFQKNPIYIRDPSETNGWRFLCDSEAGGGQGNALTGPAFVMVIDEAMKSTEEKFGITIRAIQDDMTLLGDAKVIFGTNGNNGALEFLLSALEEVGLEPNRSKFKIFALNEDEETLGFISDSLRTPDTIPQVETEGGGVAYGMELLVHPSATCALRMNGLQRRRQRLSAKLTL